MHSERERVTTIQLQIRVPAASLLAGNPSGQGKVTANRDDVKFDVELRGYLLIKADTQHGWVTVIPGQRLR